MIVLLGSSSIALITILTSFLTFCWVVMNDVFMGSFVEAGTIELTSRSRVLIRLI
jgi:hypothetical protein